MSNVKRVNLNINENEGRNLKDKFGASQRNIGLNSFTENKNEVLIQARNIETGEIEQEERGNLIVYHGRSWLMQRAYNLNLGAPNWNANSGGPVVRTNYSNMYINWLALGTGGALPGGSILQAKPSKEVNYLLDSHDVTNGYIHPNVADHGILVYGNKQYHPFDSGFPKYYDDPHITGSGGQTQIADYSQMENVSYTTTDPITGNPGTWRADSYLRSLVRVTITPEQCNGPRYYNPALTAQPYYQDLNEAGLFVSPSHDRTASIFTSSPTGMVQMFAKVTFSTIRKDSSREIVISWYVYF